MTPEIERERPTEVQKKGSKGRRCKAMMKVCSCVGVQVGSECERTR